MGVENETCYPWDIFGSAFFAHGHVFGTSLKISLKYEYPGSKILPNGNGDWAGSQGIEAKIRGGEQKELLLGTLRSVVVDVALYAVVKHRFEIRTSCI